MAGLSLVRSWSWVSFVNLQEARFPILQESAYTTDSDTELSLAPHVRFWPIAVCCEGQKTTHSCLSRKVANDQFLHVTTDLNPTIAASD